MRRLLPEYASSCSFEHPVAVVAPKPRIQAHPVVPNAIGDGRGGAIVPPPRIPAARLQWNKPRWPYVPVVHPLWRPDMPYRPRPAWGHPPSP